MDLKKVLSILLIDNIEVIDNKVVLPVCALIGPLAIADIYEYSKSQGYSFCIDCDIKRRLVLTFYKL